MRNIGLESFTKRTQKPARVKGDMEKIFVVHWKPLAGNREETQHTITCLWRGLVRTLSSSD